MKKVALITGVTGQDGAYLAEFLLDKGYDVHGVERRTSLFNTDRIDHLYQDPHEKGRRFVLHHGDMTDSSKPDGTPRKLLDISRMKAMGWSPRISLDDGLRGAYQEFLARFHPGVS